MGFSFKYKLLWLLSVCLITQAHIIQRRTIKDSEDTPKLSEALRTPQKYIIEPIQTLTKNADTVEAPPYDVVDFEIEDKFNEIEGDLEDSNLEVFDKNADKVTEIGSGDNSLDLKDISALSEKGSGTTDNISKISFSPNSEHILSSKYTQSGVTPTDLTTALTTQSETGIKTSQNGIKTIHTKSENITKIQSSETILDTKSTQTETESQTQLPTTVVTDTQYDSVASELKSDTDLKKLFSDLDQSVDKDKLLQTYGDNNLNIKIPNTDDSVIKDLTYHNNQLRNIENLKDSNVSSEIKDSEVVTKSVEFKSPIPYDSETKDSELNSSVSALKTKDSEKVLIPTESELPINSKSAASALQLNDSKVLTKSIESKSVVSALKTKDSENVLNPIKSEFPIDSTHIISDLVNSNEIDKLLPTYNANNVDIKISNKNEFVIEDLTEHNNQLRNLENSKDFKAPLQTSSETKTKDNEIFLKSTETNSTASTFNDSNIKDSETVTKNAASLAPFSASIESNSKDSEIVTNIAESVLPIVSKNLFSDLVTSIDNRIPNKVLETDNSVVKDLSSNFNGLRELETVNPDDTKNVQLKTKTDSETPIFTSVFSELPNSENLSKIYLRNFIEENSEKVTGSSNDSERKLNNTATPDSIVTELLSSEKIPQTLEPLKISETTKNSTNQIQKLPENIKISENSVVTELINSENVTEILEPFQISETTNTATNKIPKLTENIKISENSDKFVENIKPTPEKVTENFNNVPVAAKPQVNSENSLATSVDTKAPQKTSENATTTSTNTSAVLGTFGNVEKPLINTAINPAANQNVAEILTNQVNSETVQTLSENVPVVPTVAETLNPNKPLIALPKPEAKPKPVKPVKTTGKPIVNTTEKPVKVVIISSTSKPVKEITPAILNTRPPTTKPLTTKPPTTKPPTTKPPTTKPPTTKPPTKKPPTRKPPFRTTTPTRRPFNTRRTTRRPLATRRPATTKNPISSSSTIKEKPLNNQDTPQRRPVNPNLSTPVTTQRPAANPAWFPNLPNLPPNFQNLPSLTPNLQNFPNLPSLPVNQNPSTPVTTQRPAANPAWFPNFPSFPPNFQNFPRLPLSPVNPNLSTTVTTQRPNTNPTMFPNLPNLPPNLPNFPNLSSPPVLPAFFINPFNTTSTTTNQTQSTFGIGFLAIPWNWRPRNFTNIFTPNRVIDTPAVPPTSPFNDNPVEPEVSRDLAFWNTLFHRGFSTNSGVFKQWSSGPKLNNTQSTNASLTNSWKPWSSDFFKIPKFNYNSSNTTATIPANTQVLHLYLPLKYPFQGQIVTSPSERQNDETSNSSVSNKIESIPKFQRSNLKSEEVVKKAEVIADNTDKLMGEEKASLMFELELPKPVVQFVKGLMDTFWTQTN